MLKDNIVVEKLGTIGICNNHTRCGYLVGIKGGIDYIKNKNKKVVLFGCSENCFLAETLLEEHGIEVFCYTNSDAKLFGKKLRGRLIVSPKEVFSDEFHIIVAISNKNINSVRLQLMTHGIEDYSIFLNEISYDFSYENPQLEYIILKAINEFSFKGISAKDALPLLPSYSAGSGAKLGYLNWHFETLYKEHYAYVWGAEILDKMPYANVLEIGPGMGLMSAVFLEMFDRISIDWYNFGKQEFTKSVNGWYAHLQRIKEKYVNRVGEIWGYIERDKLSDKKYDMIILGEVFEHFAINPVETMLKFKNVLKEDGRLILTTPNWGPLFFFDTWRELPKNEDIDDARYMELLECGHVYQYNYDECKEVFAEAGFEIERYAVSEGNTHNIVLKIADK